MNDKNGLVKLGTRMDFLRQFRNDWMNKLIANEIDNKKNQRDLIVSKGGVNVQQATQLQGNIKRAKEFITIIDEMIVEEEKRGVAQA